MARGGVTGGSIRVQGLAQLIGDFYKIDRRLSYELRRELVEIGNIVSDEAKNTTLPGQQLAAGQGGADGRPNTGALQRSIRSKMRGQSTVVVESRRTTKRRYAYGAIYEFNKGRPFLEPALNNKTEDIMRSIDDMFTRLVSANGFGKGGLL